MKPANPDPFESIRGWLNFQQKHIVLDLPEQDVQRGIITNFFALKLESFIGMPQNRRFQFRISFFHRKLNQFFGRTLKFDRLGEDACFYTDLNDPLNAIAVLEIVELEFERGGSIPSNSKAYGWAVLNAFSPQPTEQHPIFRGSVRQVMHEQDSVAGIEPPKYITYSCSVCPTITGIQDFLPINSLCSIRDEIPGVLGGSIGTVEKEVQIAESKPLFIHRARIRISDDINRVVKEFIKDYARENKFEELKKQGHIKEIKLHLGQHNGWRLVKSDRTSTAKCIRKTADECIEIVEPLEIKNSIVDDKVAIVLDLVFTLSIVKDPKLAPELLNLYLAFGLYQPYPNGLLEEGKVSSVLLTGPGFSISGKTLWALEKFEPTTLPIEFYVSHRADYTPPFEYTAKAGETPTEQVNLVPRVEVSPRPDFTIPPPTVHKTETSVLPPSETDVAAFRPQPLSPSEEHRSLVLADKLPDPNTQSPFDKHVAFITPTIPNEERARLINSGIRGLLDSRSEYGHIYDPSLDVEADDPQKNSTILFQFLTIKPSGIVRIPNKVFFSMKFFTFPSFDTEAVEVIRENPNLPYLLHKLGPEKELVSKFAVESEKRDSHGELASYLKFKKLTIEVWNAESKVYFGAIKLPLLQLLRQGNSSVSKDMEVDIVGLDGRARGSLALIARNIGRMASRISAKTTQSQRTPMLESTLQPSTTNMIVSHAMKVDMHQSARFDSDEQRRYARIIEWKRQQKDTDYEQYRNFREIGAIRKEKKAEVIKSFIEQHVTKKQVIPVTAGCTHVLQYNVLNTFQTEECFNIRIEGDPHKEFEVISSSSEWQFWCSKKNLQKPNSWDLISQQNTFILGSSRQIPLLFKFKSYREDLADSKIQVWIDRSKGTPLCALEVEIVAQQAPIDNVFRFFEKCGTSTRLDIKNVYGEDIPSDKPFMYATNPQLDIHWLTNRDVQLILNTPDTPEKILSFNLYLYSDPFYGELIANWLIQVHCLQSVDINVQVGRPVEVSLALPVRGKKLVTLHSSDEYMLRFQAPFDKPFAIRDETNIPAVVRSDNTGSTHTAINCVEAYTNKVIYSWLVSITTEARILSKTFELKVKAGTAVSQKIFFTNNLRNWMLYLVRSSHPKLTQISNQRLMLGEKEDAQFLVTITPQREPGRQDIYVFINDSEENLYEVYLFKVNYL